LVTLTAASIGFPIVETAPEAECIGDAGGSIGADTRLTVVELVESRARR
jgi:hypothetical protein